MRPGRTGAGWCGRASGLGLPFIIPLAIPPAIAPFIMPGGPCGRGLPYPPADRGGALGARPG